MEKLKPGILNQLEMESTNESYCAKLSIEDLNEILDQWRAECENRHHYPLFIGYVGSGLYHIGGGAYCNKKAWVEITKKSKKIYARKGV